MSEAIKRAFSILRVFMLFCFYKHKDFSSLTSQGEALFEFKRTPGKKIFNPISISCELMSFFCLYFKKFQYRYLKDLFLKERI